MVAKVLEFLKDAFLGLNERRSDGDPCCLSIEGLGESVVLGGIAVDVAGARGNMESVLIQTTNRPSCLEKLATGGLL